MFYLYVKTHSVTGLKYLGYTSSQDPHKYPGSGIYWKSHLEKHGHCWTTEIVKECVSKEEIKKWGSHYSSLWDVVKSNAWANLIDERASGGDLTDAWTDQSRRKNKEARDRWNSTTKGKKYNDIYGPTVGDQIKQKQSVAARGKKLNLSESERKSRAERRAQLNRDTKWSQDTIFKRTDTFKKRQSNKGVKNGMHTKPESRQKIGDKNSKTHTLQNQTTNEVISIKNISAWARTHNLNPSTVLVKFCKGLPINRWVRISVTGSPMSTNMVA